MSKEHVFFGKFRIKEKDGTDEYEVSAEPLSAKEKDALAGIVRCRDCIFALGTASKRAKTVACTHFITVDSFENPVPSDVEPDGFCAWGKRKEVAE